jgi:microcystin-dependent protein
MDPFLGEIRTVGFNFAPAGWALCNGQAMPISENNALFALLGIQFGGNGTTTFNLPNLTEPAATPKAPAAPLLHIIALNGIFPSRP